MKFRANVIVKLKDNVKDAKGEAVSGVLKRIGLEENANIRLGKFFSLNVYAQDEVQALKKLDDICKNVLSNPVIEKYETIEFEKV